LLGCRKGSRPCEYAHTNVKSTSRTKSRRQSSQESISSDEDNAEANSAGGLDVIPDEDETAELPSSQPSNDAVSTKNTNMRSPSKHRPRKTPEVSSGPKAKSLSPASASDWVSSSLSPSSSVNSQYRSHLVQRPARDLREIFKHKRLKDDVWYFLKYHQEKLNHNHYLMNYETDMFFRGMLMDLAVNYEPLLYALVGFAAYHHTLENPRGKMYDFLRYYDRSLQLLRKSLASGIQHNEAMLATILQLSTFEVGTTSLIL
jgi:Fungal specific transcription factor domain